MASPSVRNRLGAPSMPSPTMSNASFYSASSPGNVSMSGRFDPVNTPLRKEMAQREKQSRIHGYSHSLLLWVALAVVIFVEFHVANSWMLWRLLPDGFPLNIIRYFEAGALAVSIFISILLFASLIREHISGEGKVVDATIPREHSVSSAPLTTPSRAPSPAQKINCSVLHGASSPVRSSASWLDSHTFGDSASPQRNRSINSSALSLTPSMGTSVPSSANNSFLASPLASRFDESATTARIPFQAKIAPRPASKMINSIHTQEQLERLLKSDKENEDPVEGRDSSILSQSSSYYQAMLHLDGLEPRPYQTSKEVVDNKQDAFEMVQDSNGSIHLSPRHSTTSPASIGTGDEGTRFRVEVAAQRAATAAGSSSSSRWREGSPAGEAMRRRRASASSPHRPSISASGDSDIRRSLDVSSLISEAEFAQAEQRMRQWIVNTILHPLNEGIKDINRRFEREFATLHLRIGLSSVEQLQSAITQHGELASTTLPWILPYLSIHSNQAYLVSRISALSSGSCMASFSWASGGPLPPDEKGPAPSTSTAPSTHCRLMGRPWTDSLPTDTHLVLLLFAVYMDSKITTNPLLNGHTVDQPFTARYVLVSPSKPSPAQQARGSFYIHLATLNPPSIELVTASAEGVSVLQHRSLFRVMVYLLAYSDSANDGQIDRVSLSNPSLNLDAVLGLDRLF